MSLASEILISLITRWPSRLDSLPRPAEFVDRESTAGADDPLPWKLAPEPVPEPTPALVGVELVWLLDELGVLTEGVLLWLLKLGLLDDEPVEKLGAGLLCGVLNEDEDEELDELLTEDADEDAGEGELLLVVVAECCAKSVVETSVRLAIIRINRRILYLLPIDPTTAVMAYLCHRLKPAYSAR